MPVKPLMFLIMVSVSLSLSLLSCRKDSLSEWEGTYKYWNEGVNPETICIGPIKGDVCQVTFLNRGTKTIYEAIKTDSEIVFSINPQKEIHIKIQGRELRLYKVLSEGNPLEDVEWSYYRIE